MSTFFLTSRYGAVESGKGLAHISPLLRSCEGALSSTSAPSPMPAIKSKTFP